MAVRRTLAFVLACSLAVSASAENTPSPLELQAGLDGKWTGTLGYRDYQSNKLFDLVMNTEIRVLPDKATVIRVASVDDGPKASFVYITAVRLYDPAKATVTTTTLRKGHMIESSIDAVTIVSYTDPFHWVVRYEAEGTDDDKPAMLRTVETRDGDNVRTIKEVLPKSDTSKGWQFRNQTRLSRSRSP